jgi:hypothetical protein
MLKHLAVITVAVAMCLFPTPSSAIELGANPRLAVAIELPGEEMAEIKKLVAIESSYPILSIEVESRDKVKVTTGVVRGPLDGSGHFIYLERDNGKWVVKRKGYWVA